VHHTKQEKTWIAPIIADQSPGWSKINTAMIPTQNKNKGLTSKVGRPFLVKFGKFTWKK